MSRLAFESAYCYFIALVFLLLSSFGFAADNNFCPEWITSEQTDLPVCPDDNSVVPETFPTAAVVVSDRGQNSDLQFTPKFVEKVLRSAGDQPPLVVLPVTDSGMYRIRTHIDSLKDIPQEKKILWKSLLRQVWTESYTWQQDYFESFVDANGQVVLRQVDGYSRAKGSLPGIVKALSVCGFRQGEDLKTTGEATKLNGYTGGNIEGLPGGFCLLGDSHFLSKKHWQEYGDQFCGREQSNRIEVPTSWLIIGHTDEVVKVIRNKSVKHKNSCGFSVAVASPDKAIELLKKHPSERFLDFPASGDKTAEQLAEERYESHHGLRDLCRKVKSLISASGSETGSEAMSEEASSSLKCKDITNGQVLQLLEKDVEYRRYNDLVQEKMNAFKKRVSLAISERSQGKCQPDFIELPDLFYGSQDPVKNESGEFVLLKDTGLSLLPNPANAVSMGDTIVTPEPGNTAFKNFIVSEYTQRGTQSQFVDSFNYAHLGKGNLHCVSHTVHICRKQ